MSPRIDRYAFGIVSIDGTTYTSDLIILPERVVSRWWRKEGHRLDVDDLRDVLRRRPGTLVVGSGSSEAMEVPAATREALEAAGIEVIVEPTGAAVETYNRLAASGNVAACFHLTC